MKKIGLGTRPSEMKGRDKEIELDDMHDQEEQPRPQAPRKAARKAAGGGGWKVLLVALCLLAAGVGIGSFLFGDVSFELALSRVQVIAGQQEVVIPAEGTISVPYQQGLKLKRVMYKGLYRLLPPKDAVVEVDGFPETANRYLEDLVLLLKPEERTAYEIIVSRGDARVGRVAFTVEMDAEAWILRADVVPDKKIQAECYRKAIALDPDSEVAHIALGCMYEGQRKLTQAIKEYEAVVRTNPANLQALKSLEALYKRKKWSTRLLANYERLAKADQAAADGYYYEAGRLAEKKADPGKAVALYRKGLAQNRAHIGARQRLIKLYEQDKQWKRAAANTRVLLEYEPKNADLYLYLSEMFLRLGDMQSALKAAAKAEKLKPGDSRLYLQLAMLYEKAKDDSKAITYYKKSVSKDSSNAAAYNNLGMLLERQGKRKEAITYYEKAVALAPQDIGCYTNLADAYEKQKQWKQAAGVFRKIVARDKKNKAAWESLAVLYVRLKDKWKALEAYQALTSLEPKKVLWHQKMAVLYEQLGKLEKARAQYKAILGLDSKNQQAKDKYREISVKLVKGKR
ncbi:tetratricopeptide repeat protein [Thermodesulfobacteriota bacterium]